MFPEQQNVKIILLADKIKYQKSQPLEKEN